MAAIRILFLCKNVLKWGIREQRDEWQKKKAPLLPTWASTTESTCNALGEGGTFFSLLNVDGYKVSYFDVFSCIFRNNYLLLYKILTINIDFMTFTERAYPIFEKAIADYHVHDNIDQPIANPYKEGSIEYYLYVKNWIDTVQWHFEDIIRDPQIDPVEALTLKRRIDKSNQDRTDLVEMIDSYFLTTYKDIDVQAGATINTESPAWAVDRLSILALKIYHMKEQVEREDASEEHKAACQKKLDVLLEQRVDLSTAIDQLIEDIEKGRKYMKVYKQMKMYNDPSTNPILYKGKA